MPSRKQKIEILSELLHDPEAHTALYKVN